MTQLIPADCRDVISTKSLLEHGISINEDSLIVMPNIALLTIGHTQIKIPMSTFRKFAEWYLEPQQITI